jgi:hypothetical protein
MKRKVNIRVGDIVFHRALDLGKGKVRYIYRDEVVVDFKKASARCYPRTEVCESPSHFSGQRCNSCGYVNESAA